MQSDADLNIFFDYQSAKVREMFKDAYECGRVAGRREAAEQIQSQLSGWMGNVAQIGQAPLPEGDQPSVQGSSQAHVSDNDVPLPPARAPRGAIRTALVDILKGGAARLDQIVSQTGHNPNSVRSTLYQLRSEGLAKRDGENWSLVSADDERLETGSPVSDDAKGDADRQALDEGKEAVDHPESDGAASSDDGAGEIRMF